MPTILIESPPLRPRDRRAIALRLTRWLTDRGVEPHRAIVKFTDAAPGSVLSGGLPLGSPDADGVASGFAWVTCCIGPDRDADFREALAEQIRDALDPAGESALCYIEFRPTRPDLVYTARHGRLQRAD